MKRAAKHLLVRECLDRQLPELRILEEDDRKPARLAIRVGSQDDLVDGRTERLKERLQVLERGARVEIPDVDLEHWHGMDSCRMGPEPAEWRHFHSGARTPHQTPKPTAAAYSPGPRPEMHARPNAGHARPHWNATYALRQGADDVIRRNADESRERIRSAASADTLNSKKGQGPAGFPAGPMKPAMTYFPAGQYHRRQGLNCCVRDGNRCFPLSMLTGKASYGLSPARHVLS